MNDQTPIREYEEAVYVYWYGPNLPTVKIGHSSDPDKRLVQLGSDTGVPDHLAGFAAIVWLDRKREKVEARAHELAAKFRKSGEWFELSAADALGFIISAAEELNIRFEVEDRAGLHVSKSREELRAEAAGIEKWGAKWRGMDEAEDSAEDNLNDAREAFSAAEDLYESAAEGINKHMATLALAEAKISLEAALKKLEIIRNGASPAYLARLKKREEKAKIKKDEADYWNSHPEEWAKQKLVDAELAARRNGAAAESIKWAAETSAAGVAFWKKKWGESS